MSRGSVIADEIAPILPYLRRFARTLTGSQDRGDAGVISAIEAIIAKPERFQSDVPAKQALFTVFHQVWNSPASNRHIEDVSDEGRASLADRRIERITPLPRQAFLLIALEQFEPKQVAGILGVSENAVEELLSQARREIAEQIAARVLIIEDEPLIAMDIEHLVREIGHTSVGIAKTRAEARALAMATGPEIILSDIQLADGSSGIDAVGDILSRRDIPVIFITAFPERLLTGMGSEPAFLITKPFQPAMVQAVVSQVLFFGKDRPAH